MDIVIDIETIPDQSVTAKERFKGDPVKCPLSTKGDIARDLGLDVETVKFISAGDLRQRWIDEKGSQAQEQQIESQWLKTSFDGGYGQICCICIEANNRSYEFTADNERTLLESFWREIESILNGRNVIFIAHNAKFDLPFLYHRSVINGVKPEPNFKPHGRHNSDYYCTMEAWAGFNGKIGLDRLSSILGIKGKEGMTGADVWLEYQKGNIQGIVEYCHDDVRITSEIYKRLTFK